MTRDIPSFYYVVMIDYGRRGREAVVDPELTYGNIVERVQTREYQNILFIHRIAVGETPEDVTDAIFEDAGIMEIA